MNTGCCILYVEDDRNDVFFLKYAFKEAGIPNLLQIARDGQEAMVYLANSGTSAGQLRHPPPCLVLLDLKLPYRSGLEVLELS